MQYHVELTAKAEQDVDSVLEWFAKQQAIAAGNRWFQALMIKIATLEKNPKRCALALESTELECEVRELHFGKRQGKYRILFQIERQTINILRIRHSARDKITRDDL